MEQTAKKILFVGAEAMPFAATGGLGDVLGSLPCALKEAAKDGVDVRLVIPLYDAIGEQFRRQMKEEAVFTVALAWRNQYCGVYSLVHRGVTCYFIDNEYYFKRGALYGQYDDGERYAYFCKAVMEMLRQIDWYPDILHAHDWQSALSVVYLKTRYASDPAYAGIRSVFTIHNIEYQGKYSFSILGDVFELGAEQYTLMQYDGCINLMKGAIVCADRVSTVSPRYAEEIRTPAYSHKLFYILNDCAGKLCGILNGIDTDYYNPATDPVLAQKYDLTTFPEGKTVNKLALQRELGLPERADVPMLAVISRLAAHKGVDLISTIAERLLREQDVQFVILGKGEPQYEEFFRWLERTFPDRVRALIAYDRDLSRRIYAAADLFLMPSRSEPCGLSQMIASRYGTVPVVRETGGLYDSIKGYWIRDGEVMGNGFTFSDYSADQLMERTCAALALYRDRDAFDALVKKIMQIDFSWQVSAMQYLRMYDALTGGAE